MALLEDATRNFGEAYAGIYLILSKIHEQSKDATLWTSTETPTEKKLQRALHEIISLTSEALGDLVEHPAFRLGQSDTINDRLRDSGDDSALRQCNSTQCPKKD